VSLFSITQVSISGLSACVPKQVAANQDYPWLNERERNLLIKTTGIANRRIAPPEVCASDLCFEAAQKLLEALHWEKEDIQILIFVSQTPDYQTPATAIILQERLGLPKSCLAFDINLGCSAYIYGLSVVGSLLANMRGKKGLLLVGDALSKVISEKDKSVAPLFSDAGTATALSWDNQAAPMYFNLQSDGNGYQAIIIKDGGGRNPFTHQSFQHNEALNGIIRSDSQMALNGTEVFNFGLREVAPNVEALMTHTNQKVSDIDYFVFHQANKLMNDRIKNKLQLPDEKVPYSLYDYGNTSSATIPLTMVTQLQTQISHEPLTLLLSGFGVGLSWGSALVQTKPIVCLPIIEI
jgi:3-oxoacyl-[acyl-carrier-protein] synthase-3